MIYAPSVFTIRAALEQIDGAIRLEPLPEESAAGRDLGTPVLRFGGEEYLTEAAIRAPDDEDDSSGPPGGPQVVFEVPPNVTDAEVLEALGDGSGKLQRLLQIKGTDALGWYVTFHQRAAQYGIYLPFEGIAQLAIGFLDRLALPLERRLEIAFHAILRHELFHFETDCMAANWELARGEALYWWADLAYRGASGYKDLEEALANAYMLRGLRHPGGALRYSKGSYDALRAFCERQPPGYRDGPRYARSRGADIDGCRVLSANFQQAPPRAEGDWEVPQHAFDTLILFPDPFQINWRRCPILVHDQLGILKTLGIGANLFETITGIIEAQSFLKDLSKCGRDVEIKWTRRKERLSRSVGREVERWRPGGPNCWAVRVDDNFRVHLRRDPTTGSWIAEEIGDHKSMGHG